MTRIIKGDFPFDEIRRKDGNYFESEKEAQRAGYTNDHIWSITEGDEGDVWVYGPGHHYVNVIGYIATHESHDGCTYYEETL